MSKADAERCPLRWSDDFGEHRCGNYAGHDERSHTLLHPSGTPWFGKGMDEPEASRAAVSVPAASSAGEREADVAWLEEEIRQAESDFLAHSDHESDQAWCRERATRARSVLAALRAAPAGEEGE